MKLSYSTPSTIYTVTRAARMSSASLESEFLKEAAVPWKSACRLGGKFISWATLSMAVIALPSAALGARLKETVTAGNCPWCVIESGSSVCSKRLKALRGTALAAVVAVVVFAPLFEVVTTLAGGMSVFAEGVKATEVVVAFEPADCEPDAANEVAAPGPLAPLDAPDWI